MPKSLLTFLLTFLIITLSVPLLGMSISNLQTYLGLKPISVEVAGTGSMYPSLYWEETDKGGVEEYRSSPLMYRVFPGLKFFGKIYFKSSINYGDMVAFFSDVTREILTKEGKNPDSGFIKRVVGLPGDKIELRDGYVIRNGELLSEPYIRTPRSTYGGNFLPDCKVITVPLDSYFVLGDNRKVSSDSRFDLGFIEENSIQYILPYDKQIVYHRLWRDTTKDQELLGTPTLSLTEFYQYFPQLRVNPQLSKSASLRASALLQDSNTSFSLKDATQKAGYQNIILGEFVSYGHFDASELYLNLTSFHQTTKELNNPDYDDIGLSAVNAEIDGCPTQVIVGHLGGYIPASYTQAEIESWQTSQSNLDQVISSWEKAKNYPGINQKLLQELLSLLYTRRDLTSAVLSVMDKREWLSDALTAKIKQDEEISARIETLAKQLNGE